MVPRRLALEREGERGLHTHRHTIFSEKSVLVFRVSDQLYQTTVECMRVRDESVRADARRTCSIFVLSSIELPRLSQGDRTVCVSCRKVLSNRDGEKRKRQLQRDQLMCVCVCARAAVHGGESTDGPLPSIQSYPRHLSNPHAYGVFSPMWTCGSFKASCA